MKFELDELVRITEGKDRGRIGFISRLGTSCCRVILDGYATPGIYSTLSLERLSAIERLALVRNGDA